MAPYRNHFCWVAMITTFHTQCLHMYQTLQRMGLQLPHVTHVEIWWIWWKEIAFGSKKAQNHSSKAPLKGRIGTNREWKSTNGWGAVVLFWVTAQLGLCKSCLHKTNCSSSLKGASGLANPLLSNFAWWAIEAWTPLSASSLPAHQVHSLALCIYISYVVIFLLYQIL